MPKKRINTTSKPIDLRHTKREWYLFNKRIAEINKRNKFNNYIANKITSLVRDYKTTPECVLEFLSKANLKKVNRHHIPLENYNVLKEMSKKSDVPIATIVDLIIITPILTEK